MAAPLLLARSQPHREEAFSKVKNLIRKAKARTLEALFAVTARALEAISQEDACGFFADCGHDTSRDHPL